MTPWSVVASPGQSLSTGFFVVELIGSTRQPMLAHHRATSRGGGLISSLKLKTLRSRA
jgi:hypothetical protein